MKPHRSTLRLIGEAVTVSYVADPSVGYGQFRLENDEDVPAMAAVESAWLEFDDQRKPLAGVTVFDRAQEKMVNPDRFEVGAKATLSLMVGFPPTTYEPHFGESSAVGLRVRVDGVVLQALSSLKFVRRIPYGH
ncbi:MAG: hypothetical protein HYY16_04085 [Planctomycetes bacterium]|nr:hypothetical protein [Planctomycetota bacterium]